MLLDIIQQRAIFKEIVAKTGKEPQPSTLRLEQLADGSKGLHTFDHKKNSGTRLATEIRLDENDAFFATHVRLRLKAELPTKPGSGIYQSYANQTIFPAVASEVVIADLDAEWNSVLQLTVNQKEVLRAFDMSDSRVVNTSQQSAGTNYSQSNSLDGFLPFHGVVKLFGNSTAEIKLNTPAYAGKLVQHVTAATRIYLSLEFYGFLVVGGSSSGEIAFNY